MNIWKTIKNYDKYSVSTGGEIQNNKTKRILKSCLRNGYLSVVLCMNNKKKTYNIHTIVASHFLDTPHDMVGMVVNHKNQIKTDNRLVNLEYMTYAQNTAYSRTSKRSSNNIELDHNTCRTIPTFSSYKISDKGDIYSTASCKFMCQVILPNKYHKIKLKSDNNGYRDMYIHVLVAMTYLEYIPGNRQIVINHIDGNKENNHVSNLEIVSQKQNMKHAVTLNDHTLFRKKVYYMDEKGNKVSYSSAKEASLSTSIDHSTIVKSCKNKVKHAGGIEWFYEEK